MGKTRRSRGMLLSRCVPAIAVCAGLAASTPADERSSGLSYAFDGPIDWELTIRTQIKNVPASPDYQGTLLPTGFMTDRVVLRETGRRDQDGSWRIGLQVITHDGRMESTEYSSHVTYADGKAERTVVSQQEDIFGEAWQEMLEEIPRRAMFREPIELTLKPNGETSGLDGLPDTAPGTTLPELLFYLHPPIPAGDTGPGATWETETMLDEMTGQVAQLAWVFQRVDPRAGKRLAVLRGRGNVGGDFSLTDAAGAHVTSEFAGQFSARVRFDLDRHQIAAARYTTKTVMHASSLSGTTMSVIRRVHVRMLPAN